jgi:hypothetical protein
MARVGANSPDPENFSLFRIFKASLQARGIVNRTQTDHVPLPDDEGTDTLMRRTILVKSNSADSLGNQGFCAKNTHKHPLFC